MSSESNLWRPSLTLGQCVGPIASKVREHLESRPDQSEQLSDVIGFVAHHLEQIQANIERLADEVNQLGELIEIADTSDIAIQRGAGRLKSHLERLLRDHDQVRQAIPNDADAEGRRLLEEFYRETLLQIQGWLDDLVKGLTDPTGALDERGLPAEEGNHLPIPSELTLEAPSSLTDLTRWAEQRMATLAAERVEPAARIEETLSPKSRKGSGF